MLAKESQLFEQILLLIKQLSPEYRLRLVQYIMETLLKSFRPRKSQPIRYGEFQGEKMSTLEDFTLAEWRPTEKELDGA